MTKAEIAQLLSDQMCEFMGRKAPMIEVDCWDDESGDGYKPLDRWMDRLYQPSHNRWEA